MADGRLHKLPARPARADRDRRRGCPHHPRLRPRLVWWRRDDRAGESTDHHPVSWPSPFRRGRCRRTRRARLGDTGRGHGRGKDRAHPATPAGQGGALPFRHPGRVGRAPAPALRELGARAARRSSGARGTLSIFPVLGIWMLPLGLVLLALDVSLLRRPTVRMLVSGERLWNRLRKGWQRGNGERSTRR